jgi:hypothetical protein
MFLPYWSDCALVHRQGLRRGDWTAGIAALAMGLLGSVATSHADGGRSGAGRAGVDTEHLFGFTEGTDIGTAGEREFESDSTFRSVKGSGTFADLASELEFKYTAFQNFRVSGLATFAYYDIAGVTGLDDRRQADLQSVSFNARFQVLDRDHSPFGLTLSVEPHWGFADEASGVPIRHFGWDGLLMVDRALVPDRLFGAFNLHFDTDRTRPLASGGAQQEPALGIGAALAGQVMSGVWVGGEVRYFRSYEGAGLDTLTGQAVYVGPTLWARLGNKAWLSAAFNVQVWGGAAGTTGALDLVNFERYQAKLRLGFDF